MASALILRRDRNDALPPKKPRVVANRSVYLRGPDGWVFVRVSDKQILLLRDGVGLARYKSAFDRLLAYNRGVVINVVSTDPLHSHSYPDKWNEPGHIDTSDPDSLGGFGYRLGQEILNQTIEIPNTIICGSRGGQAILDPLLATAWRGNVICINAGILTANAPLPRESFFVFLTMGQDYLPTNDTVGYTIPQFQRLAEPGTQCVILHHDKSEHMTDCYAMKEMLRAAMKLITERPTNLWRLPFREWLKVFAVTAGDIRPTVVQYQ